MPSLWRELYEARAFKPAPSLWELADTHVPFAELGSEPAPETPVRNALEEGDGVAVVVGHSGGGKSSVFAYVAAQLTAEQVATSSGHRYLPLFVPVAARPDAVEDLGIFGRGAILETYLALSTQLDDVHRDKLRGAMADQVARERTAPRFNARLMARIPGLSGEAGMQLANDLTRVSGVERLDNHGGLRTLGDIARAYGYEVVLLVEDTDAWAGMRGGEQLAEAFFGRVLRPLTANVDIAVGVAVQSTWQDNPTFKELRERAVTAVEMPGFPAGEQTSRAVRNILARRAKRGLDPEALGADPIRALFTDAAIDTLVAELVTSNSMRAPLTRIRDTLDRFADALPERIDRHHLLESF